jgi:hypothetical protein
MQRFFFFLTRIKTIVEGNLNINIELYHHHHHHGEQIDICFVNANLFHEQGICHFQTGMEQKEVPGTKLPPAVDDVWVP